MWCTVPTATPGAAPSTAAPTAALVLPPLHRRLPVRPQRQAVETLQIMPGLRELLDYLKASGDTRVALVTRNTPASVDGFLRVLGPGYEGYFDPVITRHPRHVKPDYRLLRDLADEWGVGEARGGTVSAAATHA